MASASCSCQSLQRGVDPPQVVFCSAGRAPAWSKEAQLLGETRIPDTFMDNPILILISHLEAHGGHFRVPAPCWEQGSHELTLMAAALHGLHISVVHPGTLGSKHWANPGDRRPHQDTTVLIQLRRPAMGLSFPPGRNLLAAVRPG